MIRISCQWIGISLLFICGHVSSAVKNDSVITSEIPKAEVVSPIEQNPLPLRVEDLQDLLKATTSRLTSIETSIAKTAERADVAALRTSWFSLGTVLGAALLTAMVSLLTQWTLMRHQRKLNREDAESEVANAYIEWQLKQLSEFYGPIRALLGQSNVLYRQMNMALIAADPTRFRLATGDDFDSQVFEICQNGAWIRFRTVQHLNETYNKNYGVEPYFDDVIEIGARMADVIREKAGFARSENDELVRVMGKYLAHYLVLKRLHERARNGIALHVNASDGQAVFPSEIEKLIDKDFKNINKEVMAWRKLKVVK